MRHHLFAYLLLAVAQTSIAANVVIGKYLLEQGMPTFLFLTLRFLMSAIVLTFLILLKPRLITPQHPTGKLQAVDWSFLLAQAFTGGFLFNYLFYWGVEYTSAISAGIISSTLPALIALFAFLFLGEAMGIRKLMALGLAILGILVISLDNDDPSGMRGSTWGDFLVFAAMIPEAFYSIFSKYIGHRLTPLGSATIVTWMIFLMMLPFGLLSLEEMNLLSLSMVDWGLISLGGVSSALFYWAWPKGLLVISAGTAALFAGLLPISTSFLGWYFLNEPFGKYDSVGLLLVLLSIAIGAHWRFRAQQR